MTKLKIAKFFKNIILFFCFVLGTAAVVMIAFAAVKSVDGETFYKGYEVAFRCLRAVEGGADDVVRFVWTFSFANVSAYALAFLAIVCCIAGIRSKKQGLVLAVVTATLFVLAGILFLTMVHNLQPYVGNIRAEAIAAGKNTEEVKQIVATYVDGVRNGYNLAWAPVVSAVCCFMAAPMALLSKLFWQIFAGSEKI